MTNNFLTAWQRFLGLLQLDKRDILQVFYYAIFAGIVTLTLPLGIQAIINLIQGAQIIFCAPEVARSISFHSEILCFRLSVLAND